MFRMIIRILLIGTAVYYGWQYRYRLMNVVLSNGWLRRMLVSGTLNMPFVRQRMVQGIFSEAAGPR